jgi:hypothetical protein
MNMCRMLSLSVTIALLWTSSLVVPSSTSPQVAPWQPAVYVALPQTESCLPILGESYGTLPLPEWELAQRPVERHADANLALRSYIPTEDFLGPIEISGGGDDPKAPQLASMFAQPHVPTFAAVYRVHNWNWDCDCRGEPIDDPTMTMADLAVLPGESIHVPRSGYEIGGGYQALVLHASEERLTLKYTAEDNVVVGYTLHLENVCVAPDLLALYRVSDSEGRHSLPALRAGQAVGRARSDRIGVAIRDTGAFLDLRAFQDWWRITDGSSP